MEERPENRGDSPVADGGDESAVERDRIRAVLDEHPVRLAVLFGSRAVGTADPGSDVDLAVEFEADIDDPGDRFLALLVDLSVALDRNDIDLTVVDDLEPRVGLAAFTDGTVISGSTARAQRHRERFEDRVSRDRSERSLRERLDETVDNVDRLVESGG